MYHGLLPVYKPKGITSHDCVQKVRKLLRQKRVGHTGTLDPSVEGVLLLCLGRATRIAEYVQELPKEYRGTVRFGFSTDTQDAEGRLVELRLPVRLEEGGIRRAMQEMEGEVSQLPPMFSAVKVKGKKLYQYARAGEEVPRTARKVTVYRFALERVFSQPPWLCAQFTVRCSKGTYIRTLCHDLGEKLGYPAHMGELTRSQNGPFSLEDCVTLEALAEAARQGRVEELVHPMEKGLIHLPQVRVLAKDVEEKVRHGQTLAFQEGVELPKNLSPGQRVVVLGREDQVLAVYLQEGFSRLFRPVKVLAESR